MFRILLLMTMFAFCTMAILVPDHWLFDSMRGYVSEHVCSVNDEKAKSFSEKNRLLKEKVILLESQNHKLIEQLQSRASKPDPVPNSLSDDKRELQGGKPPTQQSTPKQQSPPVDEDSHNKSSTDDPTNDFSHQQTEGFSLGFLVSNARKSPSNARRSPCEVIVKDRLVRKRRKDCTDKNRPIDQDRYPFEPRAKKRDPYRDVIIHDYRYYKQKKDSD